MDKLQKTNYFTYLVSDELNKDFQKCTVSFKVEKTESSSDTTKLVH